MVEVAPPDAGCAWAPEAIYNTDSEQYLVYWASMLGDKESEGSEGRYHRMLAARTRDFVNFSELEVYIDYGLSVIDTTMFRENGKIYRFSKRVYTAGDDRSGFGHLDDTCGILIAGQASTWVRITGHTLRI